MLPTRNPNVIFKALATGAVLYSTAEEVYFGLNAVGVRIWDLLPPTQHRLEDLCAVLYAEYPDAPRELIHADVVELLEELTKLGLVQPATSSRQHAS
ncbi:MAG: hypothetical protein JWL95_2874 [Gemmatimonadetes bacterium]|nr:hypothetical protein [Gemmatimonadota bacterium]